VPCLHEGALTRVAACPRIGLEGRNDKELTMADMEKGVALIVGAGTGLSASLARAFHREGYAIALASRTVAKLEPLCEELGATGYQCDASNRGDVAALFHDVESLPPELDVVVYNPSYRARGPLIELDPGEVEKTLAVTAFGGFLVAQEAAKRMLKRGSGAILFTGASAGVKGYPQSAPFAMGKFALRGLAQSMARELAPQGVHVAHFVIDGGIRSERRPEDPGNPDALLDPDAVAHSYIAIVNQPRSAWSWEIELRPWVEKF